MLRRSLSSLVACLTLVAMLCQGTWVLAGTTGTLSGTITDSATNQPISGAKVSVSSPSQSASTVTDAGGHYSFLSLAPDSYVLSVETKGYDPVVISGVTVQADQNRVAAVPIGKSLRTITTVKSSTGGLVRPGTTADVYSVSAATQEKVAAVGGGGNLNSAFSAIATVPGVFVAPGQSGYIGAGPSISIRGGDYDQIGYEIDGVPVNRAFDSYPSGPTSSLGQGELQVYTGGGPANAEAQGISGFINQVIRTGSYPGFSNADIGIGGPAYYHKASFEIGGASANHNFSYYVGIGGYNQDFRYADQFNGAAVSGLYGEPLAPCAGLPSNEDGSYTQATANLAPSCFYHGNAATPYTDAFVLGPYNYASTSTVVDRDNVANFHFGIPHKDGTKDDIQLLGLISYLNTFYYDSTNDQGGAALLNGIGFGQPVYLDGYSLNAKPGTLTTNFDPSSVSVYNFPSKPGNIGFFGAIPNDQRDVTTNNQAIYKLQYTKSLGANALFKVYGYSYYSNWLQNGPQTTYADYVGCCSPDYELSSHTRGVSGTFTDQIGDKNLVSLTGSATTATTLRDNNTQMINGAYPADDANLRTTVGVLVDSSNPYSGLCYGPNGAGGYSSTTCSTAGTAQFATIGQAASGTVTPATGTCGGGPCEYLITNNGEYATYNTVKPNFYSGSLTDEFRPTSQLSINAGIRLDVYQFVGSNTQGTAARTFWYNAFNMDNCFAPNDSGVYDKITDLGLSSVSDPCPTGYYAPNVVNPAGNVTETYNEWQPRLGATYTLNPTTVLRASYGRYAQAPNSAFQQYDALQQNAPAVLYTTYGFQKFGFTSPDHSVVPPVSNNYDFSIEKQFANQISLKVSPFYRNTQNQIQQFYLNQQSGFVSGLNVGRQTSRGVEFELDKGNFNQNGLSARLSFTYTNSYINYNHTASGFSVIDPFNQAITAYNDLTKFCYNNPNAKSCGGAAAAAKAAPCYTTSGAADFTCAASSVANPYWNAPAQGLMDVNGNYATYDTFPAGIGTAVAGYGAPYTASLVLNERANKLSIAPIVQFYGGQRYGSPESTEGIDPSTCTATLGTSPTGDPRYKYGAAGGSAFDASSCGTLAGGIPDPYTGAFDGLGAFVAPNQLQLHLQLSYDVTKNFTLVANVTNIVNACFGGTKVGFVSGNVNGSSVCGYGVVGGGTTGDIGNTYNPGAYIQPYTNTPYEPSFQTAPLGFYVNGKFKI